MKNKEIFLTINKMAIPLLLTSLSEIIFTVADQAIIGRTSIDGFASVGVVSNLIYLLTGTLGALTVSFGILFGRSIRTNNYEVQSKIFYTSFNLAICIGLVFGIFSFLFGEIFLKLFYGFSDKLLEHSYEYISIASWGLGLNLMIFLLSSYFKNMKNTRLIFFSHLISLVINFIIDYVLVFGQYGFPKMGIKGAAIGTVVGLSLNLIILLIYFIRTSRLNFIFKIEKEVLKELLRLYFPIMGQDFVENTFFIIVITAIVTRLDIYSIAAYNLIEILIMIIILPAHVFGGVSMTLVSQNYKENNTKEIANYTRLAILSCLFLSTYVGFVFVLFPDVIKIISKDYLLLNAVKSIFVFSLGIQFFNIISQIYKYTLQSMFLEKWVFKYSTFVSIIGCLVVFTNVSYLKMDLKGVYFGFLVMYLLLTFGYIRKFKQT